ncbi:BamA/TamA family outer membrane protein [Neolewinella lacunae]|uniref:BamA/TamA family outer membrane protein n=1 Tax=Neolewinella lacunae TaxID=1517758 RepID=A0A923T7Z4_9BACT|nr:BamA/TamA family outer membrane protein [Neolewinella lacunae]MBC6994031.1 BamA/TamA family outer membrane protein [Neolewinella lacunae]MDN3634701.1 BamA/TamA family outer membrane protein [Neolewinella lacunae]
MNKLLLAFTLLCALAWGKTQAQQRDFPTAARWSFAPVIGYAPETKWQFGINATLLYQGSRADSIARRSNANAVAILTTNQQYFFHTDHRTFLRGEKWFLPGEIDLYKFPQFYYGIGAEMPRSNEESIGLSYFQAQQQALFRIRPSVFVGGGLRYFNTFNLSWPEGGVLASENPAGLEGSSGLGPMASFLLDNRDDILTPTRNCFLNVTWEGYRKNWAGTHNFSRLTSDLRAYFPLDQKGKKVLAFQLLQTMTAGEVPFTELALLGGENTMRGIYRGRFRDRHLLAGQAEYRFGLLPWLGATTFVGLGNVSNQWLNFSAPWRMAGGVGLRFAVIPGENVALRMDIAFAEGGRNFYFGFAEAF